LIGLDDALRDVHLGQVTWDKEVESHVDFDGNSATSFEQTNLCMESYKSNSENVCGHHCVSSHRPFAWGLDWIYQ
jgi:hypothetical protein